MLSEPGWIAADIDVAPVSKKVKIPLFKCAELRCWEHVEPGENFSYTDCTPMNSYLIDGGYINPRSTDGNGKQVQLNLPRNCPNSEQALAYFKKLDGAMGRASKESSNDKEP